MKNFYKHALSFALSLFVLSASAYAQFTVTGTVTDAESNEPLFGVTILNVDSG